MSTPHDWPAALKAMDAADYPSGKKIKAASYQHDNETWTVAGRTTFAIFVSGQHSEPLHGPDDKAEFEGGEKGHSFKQVDGVRAQKHGPILARYEASELRRMIGPLVVLPKSTVRDCEECDGEGVQECNLGHDHECEECGGRGTIGKEPQWPESQLAGADDLQVDCQRLAILLAAVPEGLVRISTTGDTRCARFEGDGWVGLVPSEPTDDKAVNDIVLVINRTPV